MRYRFGQVLTSSGYGQLRRDSSLSFGQLATTYFVLRAYKKYLLFGHSFFQDFIVHFWVLFLFEADDSMQETEHKQTNDWRGRILDFLGAAHDCLAHTLFFLRLLRWPDADSILEAFARLHVTTTADYGTDASFLPLGFIDATALVRSTGKWA